MRVVILDNYDSFTYNLFQYVAELGIEAEVHRNDALDLDDLRKLDPTHIIISPGPGTPERPRDFGICAEAITELSDRIPTLGVCLGHQGIIHGFGGKIVRAPEIVHGKTSLVRHDGSLLFRGLPETIEVMRYHSLVGARGSIPACLRVTAALEGPQEAALVMGVQHVDRPLYGIQFHPESIGTPLGKPMLQNFLEGPADVS